MKALPNLASAAADPAAGSRQAALLLHGIGAADRAWLLGELAAGQRRLLETLLAELHALGLPPSPELIDELLSPQPPASRQPADAINATDAAVAAAVAAPSANDPLPLEALPAELVAAVLRLEPDALVTRLLGDAPAPWRQAVLRRLGAARRGRLLAVAARGDVAAAPGGERLAAALAAALRERCRAASVATPTPRAVHPGTRLTGLLRRLARPAGADASTHRRPS